MTKQVMVGALPIGGGAPVSIQSMTNTPTEDIAKTLSQINELAMAGCDLVRVSVYNQEAAGAIKCLVSKSPVPLVADVHFDYKLAIAAIENGIHKLRINPGNIGAESKIKALADCAKMHKVPIRIGVNGGSLEKEILKRDGHPTAKGMVDSALLHIKLLVKYGFDDIVISLKTSDVRMTVEAYELMSRVCDYPLHVGVTEAGLPGRGTVKSDIAIGALLLQNIGDTIRVSLTGSPLPEPKAALEILYALGIRKKGVNLISCPTCGRTCIDIEGISKRVEQELNDIDIPITVAVMGCVVNGPGEAKEADIGIAGGKDSGALFIKGHPPRKVTGDLAEILIKAVHDYIDNL